MKHIEFLFVSVFAVAGFFAVAPEQAFARHTNNCSSNRCVTCADPYGNTSYENWGDGKLATLKIACANSRSLNGGHIAHSRIKAPDPLQFHQSLTLFYDNNLNIAHPWATAPEMNSGGSGEAFDYLLLRLIDYGFYKDFTVDFPTSYDSKIASAVTDLRKALGLGRRSSATTTTTAFTIATRNDFIKFIHNLLAASWTAGEKTEKFDIVWADGRVSLFTVDLRFSIPSTAFNNIPTPSNTPTFIRKDTDRKVYQWDSVPKKWNLTPVEFPTPKTTLAQPH